MVVVVVSAGALPGRSVVPFVIGLAALGGELMGLDAMYRIASLNRMAVFTALGMTTLSLGLGLYAMHGSAKAACHRPFQFCAVARRF